MFGRRGDAGVGSAPPPPPPPPTHAGGPPGPNAGPPGPNAPGAPAPSAAMPQQRDQGQPGRTSARRAPQSGPGPNTLPSYSHLFYFGHNLILLLFSHYLIGPVHYHVQTIYI